MRLFSALLVAVVGSAAAAAQQSCSTGLCLQQVSCPAGQTTSISGIVLTPNGTDPLPNALVYIPNAPVAPFAPGVSCPVPGQPPSGSPIVGTVTGVNGSFTISNVPVGVNIPLVIQSGRWRRQLVVPGTAACANTSFSARMPKNQTEGDIPKIAVATGGADQVECVLRKVGVDDTEFTDASGSGRINLFVDNGTNLSGPRGGQVIDSATPGEAVLMGNSSVLNSYDVLMLPCEGGEVTRPPGQLANLIQFANTGGRVYTSHFSYDWMYQNPPFDSVAKWAPNQPYPFISGASGPAIVDTTFSEGQTLSDWMQLIGASTTPGQITVEQLRHDQNGVNASTQSWLKLNDPADGNPMMQFVFDTPVGQSAGQCGRVLYNEYHVEGISGISGQTFPSECNSGAMTPQEKLLEYSLFELTSDGGASTLNPTSGDFGSEAINFSTAAKTFTWTNNPIFPSVVTQVAATGDFHVLSNNCANVPAGGSCQISVVFSPTALGPRTGTLTVGTGGTMPQTAPLTGIGTPDLTISATALDFGNVDVTASSTKTLTVTNIAQGSVPVPPFSTTGDYKVATSCGAVLAAGATCAVNVTFTPTATGQRTGVLSIGSVDPAYSGVGATLTGNGVDFSIAVNPMALTVIGGFAVTNTATTTPIAGFSAPVTLSCTTNIPASTCTLSGSSFVLSSPVTTTVTYTTTAEYAIVGYGLTGGRGWLWVLAVLSGGLLFRRRRGASGLVRAGLLLVLCAAGSTWLSGCSGKVPAQNAVYTTPGAYQFTIAVTDGFLTHTASGTLTVTSK